MRLNKLNLINFKNYEEIELVFNPEVNCFVGNNGAGKTNLLDAVHYLSLCKSYFNPIDSQQIRSGQDFFLISGVFEQEHQQDTIFCGLKKNQKKQFKRNKKEYNRLADHIGQFPLVMISPNDISLILEGSEERRKFIDNVLSQTDNKYLDTLIYYNKVLTQRNNLLRQYCSYGGNVDFDLISIYDDQLVNAGNSIYQKRKDFLTSFKELFDHYYKFISGQAEPVELKYLSQLHTEDYKLGLERAIQKDTVLTRTTFGIHKDELEFTIREYPLKKFGSQGQQKSFLIALKLAQYAFLSKVKGVKPLLLLDDIYDKLDSLRVEKLMEIIVKEDFGQIFITDTDPHRLGEIFQGIDKPFQIIEVEKGNVKYQ